MNEGEVQPMLRTSTHLIRAHPECEQRQSCGDQVANHHWLSRPEHATEDCQHVPRQLPQGPKNQAHGRCCVHVDFGQHLWEGVEAAVEDYVQSKATVDDRDGRVQQPARANHPEVLDHHLERSALLLRRGKLEIHIQTNLAVVVAEGLQHSFCASIIPVHCKVGRRLMQPEPRENQADDRRNGAHQKQPAPIQVAHHRIVPPYKNGAVEFAEDEQSLRQRVHHNPPVGGADL
mmetsp:Transcript_56559/g.183880  ORF Transcript_56559/g.183880 Transcript_56559/m.183880 type:complete len:232 (-) Transcript_56559:512-1207(-)